MPNPDSSRSVKCPRCQAAVVVAGSQNGPRKCPYCSAVLEDPGNEYDFTVTCPLCSTRWEVGSEAIGTKTRCPDCHSQHRVPEPPPKARRPRCREAPPEDPDEFRLSEPAPPLPDRFAGLLEQVARESLPETNPAATTNRWTPPAENPRPTSLEQPGGDGSADSLPPLPAQPMTDRVFAFLANPAMAIRCFFMVLAWWLELQAIQWSVELADGGMMEKFGSVILRAVAAFGGLLLIANLATAMLAILQDSSQGRDELETLPGPNPVEWFFESWQLLASLALVLFLPALLIHLIWQATESPGWVILLGGVVTLGSLVLVFPLVLLSLLESSTPFSRTVLDGLRLAGREWRIFLLQSVGLITVGLGCLSARLITSAAWLNVFWCSGMILSAVVYFRLLGRLTWVCQSRQAAVVTEEEP